MEVLPSYAVGLISFVRAIALCWVIDPVQLRSGASHVHVETAHPEDTRRTPVQRRTSRRGARRNLSRERSHCGRSR
ncbi:hypothetical protein PSAB6_110088 [Paraburkholderia sabiae]|nr:hypothetical protein PSAB6_110088 [Paraburkholderia sabiae]